MLDRGGEEDPVFADLISHSANNLAFAPETRTGRKLACSIWLCLAIKNLHPGRNRPASWAFLMTAIARLAPARDLAQPSDLLVDQRDTPGKCATSKSNSPAAFNMGQSQQPRESESLGRFHHACRQRAKVNNDHPRHDKATMKRVFPCMIAKGPH